MQQQATHENIDFTDLNQWKTLEEVEQLFPHFKKSTLSWLLRKRNLNGLDKIVKKIGKHNYVHAQAFSVWISLQ